MQWTRHQGGWTALHYAADDGDIDIEVARLLLDRGVDVNSKDKVSDTIREVVITVCVFNLL